MKHDGRCHCGAIRLAFDSAAPLAPRACQCRFCRRHDARMVSNPAGSVVLELGPEARRYRFGTRATDFLFCGRCGSYVGAAVELDGRDYATLNLNVFDDPHPQLTARPVSYDDESAPARAGRRRRNWTPARLVDG
ncbi:MAG: GFA family protein [Allosphingosinicella sp.]